jgi:membrane-bound ClpP family serine protease
VSAIVLNLDTPGGAVNGVDELARAIFAARERKRIIAYVGGMGASAGYWLASAASEIVVSDAAILGSIGVRMVAQDTTEADRKSGRVEFISSQSPANAPTWQAMRAVPGYSARWMRSPPYLSTRSPKGVASHKKQSSKIRQRRRADRQGRGRRRSRRYDRQL